MANDKKAHVDSVIEKLTEFHKQATDLVEKQKRLKDECDKIYADFIKFLSTGSGDILSLQSIFNQDIRSFSSGPPGSDPGKTKYNIEESLQNVLLYRQVGMGE